MSKLRRQPLIMLALISYIFVLLFGISPGNASLYSANSGQLIIEVDNIKRAEGIIWVGIYVDSNYMIKEKAIIEGVDVETTGKIDIQIPALAFGTYAIALFHDINGNGELDQNLIGVPTEPFAFSQIPKSKWRMPKFREIQFDFAQDNQVVHTRLSGWWRMKGGDG